MQPLAALVPLNPRRDGACPVLGAPPNYGRARIRNDEWKILGRRFRDSYQGIASAMPQALEIRSSFSSLQKNSVCSCFWVTQRFTAAITNLFSAPALAAEVTLRRGKHFFRNLLGDLDNYEMPGLLSAEVLTFQRRDAFFQKAKALVQSR
jgi:hypothetical protein